MSSERDPRLGAAIRAVPVPEREPDFMDDLAARLAAVETGRERAAAAAGAHGGVTVVPARRARLPRRLIVAVAATAVAAAVVLVMLLGPGRGTTHQGGLTQPLAPLGGPEPASAQEVIRASLRATGAAPYLRGVMTAGVVRKGRFVPAGQERFLLTATGSCRISGRPLSRAASDLPVTLGWLGGGDVRIKLVEDASARTGGIMARLSGLPTPQTQAAIVRDLPAGEPYLSEYLGSAGLPLTLRSFMRQLLDVGSLRLRTATVDGRRCWVISTTMASSQLGVGEPAATPVRIAVDRRTLFPVRFTSWTAGRASQVRILYTTGGKAPATGAFTLAVPPGTHIVPVGPDFSVGPDGTSAGFKPIPFGDRAVMTQSIGFQPALPSWMPAGFVRAVATYHTAKQPDPYSTTVSLAYRRGFDVVYVGVQPNAVGHGSMSVDGGRYTGHFGDPFAQLYGPAWKYVRSKTRDVVIRSGPFAGRTAHIVVDPSMLPHLWVRTPLSVATVSGDLSAAAMVRVVESLRTGEEVAAGRATVK